ncbi:MAG: hypothetical protein G01um101472_163 [Parcubacteria group bacterium Gr01-1014_72]|nr:MAG: hypothetical protein G01um101472_163 [Parcubacteria group bacterium Gr01-1014_72]
MQQNKKKILYIITKSNWGGAGRYVYDLATALPKEEYEVHVALGGDGLLAEKLRTASITVHHVQSLERDIRLFREVRAFKELLSIIRATRPSILHLNSPKAAGLGALAGRLLGVKNILTTSHGWAFFERRTRLSRLLIQLAVWAIAILSHHIIVVSKQDRAAAMGLPGIARKITLIRNGVREVSFRKKADARAEILSAHRVPASVLWVGTVAELHRNKGLKDGVQAFSLLKRDADAGAMFVWVIIGEGEERHALEEAIKENRLRDQIILVGERNDAALLLAAFDIFLLPSHKEGLPYTLLEAGSAGVPVVATSVGGVPDLIRDMENGVLIKPRRPREIARALRFFLTRPLERKRQGENLRRTVTEQFSFKDMFTATERLYRGS